jgi:phosphoglycerate dehydrogenase-like enzyme
MATGERPQVLLAALAGPQHPYFAAADLRRLEGIADWRWLVPPDELPRYRQESVDQLRARLLEGLATADAAVLMHWPVRIDAEVMDRVPRLRFIGDLEADRFALSIDLEAAWERGIRVVDTTNGSSYPTSEWALALLMISLRNAGAHFRRIVGGGEWGRSHPDPGYDHGELTGKRVGLIGCGHAGRRLLRLLRPFDVEVWVYDPYIPHELAEALGFVRTSLDRVLSGTDAIVCLAPLTPATRRLIGARELDLIRPGAAFVNVSRGAIVDPDALVARLQRGDIVAGLDVFDPEPIPAGHVITTLPNVFLSPHIAGTTAESRPRFFALMVDELARFYAGHDTHYDLSRRSRANRLGEPPSA